MTHHPRRPRPGEPGGTVDPGYRLQLDVTDDGTIRLRSAYSKADTIAVLEQITRQYAAVLATEIAGLQ